MQLALMIAISIHVLAGVFWAGSSFVVARSGGNGGERLFAPQMIAACVVILSGGYLWRSLHDGSIGPMEWSLGLGVAGALLAFTVQVGIAAPAFRSLRRAPDDRSARTRLAGASRLIAVLLAIATIAMAAARYA